MESRDSEIVLADGVVGMDSLTTVVWIRIKAVTVVTAD